MDNKKLVKVIAEIIRKEVAREFAQARREILSEVTGMLHYSESQLREELGSDSTGTQSSDYRRVMNNLKKMPTHRANPSRQRPEMKETKRYAGDSMLNELLNDTQPLGRDGTRSALDMIGYDADEPGYEEPWDDLDDPMDDAGVDQYDQSRHLSPPQSRRPKAKIIDTGGSNVIVGTDNRTVNVADEKVKSVLDIINNTDFAEKFRKIEEAGNALRESGAFTPGRVGG